MLEGTVGSDGDEITPLLAAWDQGRAQALDRLVPVVYGELRRLAVQCFARESPGHTLQPTSLVHEVYFRLLAQRRVGFENRAQFFAGAAVIMRRILVDHARRKRAAKRGGGAPKIGLEDLEALPALSPRSANPPRELDAMAGALEELARVDLELARLVQLRFVVGCTDREIAAALGVSERTVSRRWRTARAWLYLRLRPGRGHGS